jgi:hypothetical protein
MANRRKSRYFWLVDGTDKERSVSCAAVRLRMKDDDCHDSTIRAAGRHIDKPVYGPSTAAAAALRMPDPRNTVLRHDQSSSSSSS